MPRSRPDWIKSLVSAKRAAEWESLFRRGSLHPVDIVGYTWGEMKKKQRCHNHGFWNELTSFNFCFLHNCFSYSIKSKLNHILKTDGNGYKLCWKYCKKEVQKSIKSACPAEDAKTQCVCVCSVYACVSECVCVCACVCVRVCYL